MEYLDSVNVNVPRIPQEELIDLAVASHNAGLAERQERRNERRQEQGRGPDYTWDGGGVAGKDPNPLYLQRICVNYLRHHRTGYDLHRGRLRDLFDPAVTMQDRLADEDAYIALKRKILAAITQEYPWLTDECKRQGPVSWLRMAMEYRGNRV
jgi:hypothetical protein